jgi:hypothetical protein
MPVNAAVGLEHVWCHALSGFVASVHNTFGVISIIRSAILRYRVPCMLAGELTLGDADEFLL